MATATGILNMQTAAQAVAGRAAPMADSASGSDGSNAAGGDSATVSANDFLTLLVTEMRNQDPTTATDPNQYINQLVQVNSLQQLIGINQTLTAAFGTPATASTRAAQASGPTAAARAGDTAGAGAAAARAAADRAVAQPASAVSGNLSVPASHAAARRVAHALDHRGSTGLALPAPAVR